MTTRCRVALVAACSVVFLLLFPAQGRGCSCVAGIPICETFWKTPVVFAGEVTDITPIPRTAPPNAPPERRVRFKVERVWRGNASESIDIMTGAGGGDCGYDFRRGERYLVFTHEQRGALWTGICSRTKPLSAAKEDLAYLDQQFFPAAGGRIFGDVTHRTQPREPSRPAPNYGVTLRSVTREWKATTNAEGRYELSGIPAGIYQIALSVPPTEHGYGPSTVEMADARGCAAAHYTVVPDGRVVVRLVDSEGRPLPRLGVEIVRLASMSERFPDSRRQQTNAEGEVQFAQLAPDRYVVGINITDPPEPTRPYGRVFYPSVTDLRDAQVVHLGYGERVQLEAFKLPQPLAARKLAGRLVWPDGRPAAGASVYLIVTNGRQVGYAARTDADGRFELSVHEGVTYRLNAFIDLPGPDRVQWSVRSGDILVQGDVEPIQLVLAPPRR